ncbi:hypothetical protein PanWU01x14_317600, partial [Parasponia andersonii]
MPRSSRRGELQYDPKIEKTVRQLKKEAKLRDKQTSSSPELNLAIELTNSSSDSETESKEDIEETMANRERNFEGTGCTR